MSVSVRWVVVNGEQLLSVSLPGNQYVTLDPATGWQLLLHLRAAMRRRPRWPPDNRERGN